MLSRHDAILRHGPSRELDGRVAHALTETAAWLEAEVSRPHSSIGRPGDVCPWTRRASERGALLLGACLDDAPQRIDALISALMQRFLDDREAIANAGVSRAIVVVFPEQGAATEARVIAAHARLKPQHLARGLMLGEFFPSCDKRGLHNRDFRPLRSPWPLLVIRPMVEADVEFLWDEDRFAQAYLTVHGARGRLRLAQLLVDRKSDLGSARVESLKRLLR